MSELNCYLCLEQICKGGLKTQKSEVDLILAVQVKAAPPLGGRACFQAGSLSTFHSCSLTSVDRVLNRSSSTTRPVLFSCLHSPSSTGRHSRRFPLSSSCVSPVSSPKRDGRDCRQLFPKFKVRSFLHWNSSFGRLSIF